MEAALDLAALDIAVNFQLADEFPCQLQAWPPEDMDGNMEQLRLMCHCAISIDEGEISWMLWPGIRPLISRAALPPSRVIRISCCLSNCHILLRDV